MDTGNCNVIYCIVCIFILIFQIFYVYFAFIALSDLTVIVLVANNVVILSYFVNKKKKRFCSMFSHILLKKHAQRAHCLSCVLTARVMTCPQYSYLKLWDNVSIIIVRLFVLMLVFNTSVDVAMRHHVEIFYIFVDKTQLTLLSTAFCSAQYEKKKN